jgi:hypothetical protein
MVKGKLGPLGGAIDNDQVRQVFLDEFRQRLKYGGKELRHGTDRVTAPPG